MSHNKLVPVVDHGHDYSQFKYYILRVANQGRDVDFTERFGGSEAGREDDRVSILTDGKVVTCDNNARPRIFTDIEGLQAIQERVHGAIVLHGTDSDELVQLSAIQVEKILQHTQTTLSNRGYYEHPQVAGYLSK